MTEIVTKLEISNLDVSRGLSPVIVGMSMSVAGPGWFGLVGANGSGKTTLLRAIAGRLPHANGQIVINGNDMAGNRAGRAECIGFAIEPAMLPSELTPKELFSLADPNPGRWNELALEALRQALNISALQDRRCKTLSAGNLQRIAIYAAFLGLPRIVILDEPFNWLDPVVTSDLKDAIRKLIDSEKLLVVTALHDLATLTTRCDECALIASGRLIEKFGRDELRLAQTDPISFERKIALHLRSA